MGAAREYAGSNVVVLGICSWTSRDEADSWIAANSSAMTYAIDPSGDRGKNEISSLYGVKGIPTTFIIDQNGNIVDGKVSMVPDDIDDDLQRLGIRRPNERRTVVNPQSISAEGANHQAYVPVAPIMLKGYMSAKAVDPYAGLTEAAALAKAKMLCWQRAASMTSAPSPGAMGTRGMTAPHSGPIYEFSRRPCGGSEQAQRSLGLVAC